MESLISKIHSPFGHEHNLGRAALLGSLNIKAAHRRRPTDIVTKFLGRVHSAMSYFALEKL